MKRRFLFVFLVIAVISAVIPAFADEALYWSNFNNDPVKNGPKYYGTFPIPEDHAPVLITRVRTFHWNSGDGAEPGSICVVENGEELQCWQAIGRSAYGSSNVYWEALTDFVMQPGHTYGFKDSDYKTWSYNDASKDRGMIELYGEDPAPGTNAPAASSVSPFSSSSAFSSYTVPANLSAGQTFLLGHFEQDNNYNNGAEPIEWQVLTVQKDRALVISKYALSFDQMNPVFTDTTWETSALRKYLNGDFYNNAFSASEKSQILLVTNENPNNPQYGTKGGNLTQDRIFLLSYVESLWYFKTESDRAAMPTAYAVSQSKDLETNRIYSVIGMTGRQNAAWWLRTPGIDPGYFLVVNSDGSIPLNGQGPYDIADYSCETMYFDVRPAFWIKMAAVPTPTPTPTPRNCYKVTYKGNNCLTKVPTDNTCYQPGDLVWVLFEPVEYVPGLIFNGWDRTGDGVSDHGYYYNNFVMPAKDVELNAICYQQIYDRQDYHQDNNVVTRPDDPGYFDHPNYPINDTGTSWWYDDGGVG